MLLGLMRIMNEPDLHYESNKNQWIMWMGRELMGNCSLGKSKCGWDDGDNGGHREQWILLHSV